MFFQLQFKKSAFLLFYTQPYAHLSLSKERPYTARAYAGRAPDIRRHRHNGGLSYSVFQNNAEPRTTSSGWMATLVADSFPSILSLSREAHIPPKSSGLLSRLASSGSQMRE